MTTGTGGFVKLYSSMLQSTTWQDRDLRDLFITALLLARPRTLREPMEQLHVDRLEATGWKVPPGRYGWCDTSGTGLISTAKIEPESGMIALRALGDPEPSSRSQDHDGRRLVRVDGGYVVLNYGKHRDTDTTAAERARRYREKKRRQGHTVTSRDITQAEAEAEADQHHPPPAGARVANPDPDPDASTVCPLNLVETFPAFDELAEHFGVSVDAVKAAAQEFVDYWVIGGGAQRRKRNWPRVLREDLRRKHDRGDLAGYGSRPRGKKGKGGAVQPTHPKDPDPFKGATKG